MTLGPIQHGTPNGYSNRGCRCEDCCAAWRTYCGERRRARAASRPQDPPAASMPRITAMDPHDDLDGAADPFQSPGPGVTSAAGELMSRAHANDDHAPMSDRGDHWSARAACQHVDPELWYPEVGESAKPAKFICNNACAVRAECLLDVMIAESGRGEGLRHGVWGGMTAHERWELDVSAGNAQGPAPRPRCPWPGQGRAVERHRRNGEVMCVACRAYVARTSKHEQAQERARRAVGVA